MQKGKQKIKTQKTRKPVKTPFSSLLSNQKRKTMFMSGIGAMVLVIANIQISSFIGPSLITTFGYVGAMLVGVVPYAMISVKQVRRRDSIDRNLPIFLLALVSSVQSGQSLLRAIEEAADRNMGSLTPELKNLRANISWGMPIEEAFDNFNKRVSTRMAQRVTTMLQLAIHVGGDVVNTLEVIQTHVTEMQNIEKERKSALQPYIFTIYISFFVFLVIAVILVSQFFTQIEVVQNKLIESSKNSNVPIGMFSTLLGVKIKDIDSLMFNMSIVEAIFGGIAAGKIGEGSFVGGIKHVIIMVVVTVLIFTVLVK